MEKQKITVRVAGKSYTLVSSDPPEHVRRVAELVDRRLKEMELTSNLPSSQILTLTCLNLEDQLVKAQDEITELKRRMAGMVPADKAESVTAREKTAIKREKPSSAESKSDLSGNSNSETGGQSTAGGKSAEEGRSDSNVAEVRAKETRNERS